MIVIGCRVDMMARLSQLRILLLLLLMFPIKYLVPNLNYFRLKYFKRVRGIKLQSSCKESLQHSQATFEGTITSAAELGATLSIEGVDRACKSEQNHGL